MAFLAMVCVGWGLTVACLFARMICIFSLHILFICIHFL